MTTSLFRSVFALALTFAAGASFAGCTRAVATSTTPDLCSLDDGRWCQPCSGSTCHPGEDSGWLCCNNGACIAVQLSSECTTGTVGWCSDYYEVQKCNDIGTCVDVAVCEDH